MSSNPVTGWAGKAGGVRNAGGFTKSKNSVMSSAAASRAVSGDKLKRVPRGFPADHPAAEYLKFKLWVGGADFPATLATGPGFYKTLLAVFRQVMPLTRFLNAPLLKG